MIKPLKKVSQKLKTLKMDNLKDFCSYPINLTITENGLKSEYGVRRINKFCPNDEIVLFSRLPYKIFAVSSMGDVIDCKYRDMEVVGSIATEILCVLEVYSNGEKKTLVVNDEVVCFDNQVLESIPCGTCAITHLGRVVVGKENKLFITAPFDYENFTTSLLVKDEIVFDGEKIIELFSDGKDLFVICENSIKKIVFDEEESISDYQTVYSFGMGEEAFSFASEQTYCAFYNNGLKIFDGKTVKDVESILDGLNFKIYHKASIYEDKYFLNCVIDGENLTFVYDFNTKEQSFIKISEKLCGNVFAKDGYVYEIVVGKDMPFEKQAIFKSLDFFSVRDKTLHSIEFLTSENCTLEITGSFGKKTYSISKGNAVIKTNLTSKVFQLKITSEEKINLEKISLKYTIKGE